MTRSGVRFTGGEHRGRRLAVPPGNVRPTEARVREALFSVWQVRLPGSSLLDLFAGSGAVGLEALARGAEQVIFVEGSAKVLRTLMANCETFAADRGRVIHRRLPGKLPELEQSFDLIFADPPYAFEGIEDLLPRARHWIAAGGELAIEHSRRRSLPDRPVGWRRRDLRCYGESCLSFYLPDPDPGPDEAPKDRLIGS